MSQYQSLLEKMNGQEYSHYFTAVCPFHQDAHPSLFVYDDGTFRCAACRTYGKHEKLARKISHGFSPVRNTVSSVLPKWKSWERQYGDLEGIAEHAHNNLKEFPRFRKYYKERKCEKFIDVGLLGYIEGWAVIPVFGRNQEILDIVVRAISNKHGTRYVVHPISSGDGHPLYCPNWKRVIAHDTIYVVYGIFDAISLELCGLPVVTGVTGKSLSPELLVPLGKKLVIVPDRGEEKDAHMLANKLGWRGKVKELRYPDGVKDPDGIRCEYGNSYLQEMLTCVK